MKVRRDDTDHSTLKTQDRPHSALGDWRLEISNMLCLDDDSMLFPTNRLPVLFLVLSNGPLTGSCSSGGSQSIVLSG
jgi:hypothetical protein